MCTDWAVYFLYFYIPLTLWELWAEKINQKPNIEKVTKEHFTIVIAKIYGALKFEFSICMTVSVMGIENTLSLIYSLDNLNISVTQLLSCTSPIP